MASICTVCELVCDDEFQLRQHETGRKHRTNCLKLQGSINIDLLTTAATITLPRQVTPTKAVSPSPSRRPNALGSTASMALNQKNLYCQLCCIQVNSADQLEIHLRGQKHRKKASKCMDLSQTSAGNQIVCDVDDSAHQSPVPQCDVVDLSAEFRGVSWRTFTRSCREYLAPIWPDVTFTQGEADTLVVAAEFKDDCILLLDDLANAWFRVGIHLITGLLTANQDSNYSNTSAVWISPNVHVGPDPQLLSTFRFPPTIRRNKQGLKPLISLPPFEKSLSDCDLFLTDPDNFCHSLATVLFQQDKICCLILQQADQLALNPALTDILWRYMHHFPTNSRARIMCLTDTHVPSGCLFEKFRLIHFTPVTSHYRTDGSSG